MREGWTEFQNLIADRYGDAVYADDGTVIDEEAEIDYIWLVNGPEQYENEDEMLEYAKAHPDATLKELAEHWFEITPEGDPPCASEWDDDNDEGCEEGKPIK